MSNLPQVTIPARMMNEFVYCPRLFYLEFVEGVFVDNADTLEGKTAHKRVDTKRAGKLPSTKTKAPEPDPEGSNEPEVIHSRSISLYSEQLGVTAKLDLAEIRQQNGELTVIPVEYKKGSPRESDEGPEVWDTDQMQLGLQMLLLEENGYSCPHGVLYYRETRQRVPFHLTPEKIQWIEETVQQAREATTKAIPPPLENSPKCVRCSLHSICLPDESRVLHHTHIEKKSAQLELGFDGILKESSSPSLTWENALSTIPLPAPPSIQSEVRRLVAPNPETRALYLNTPGQFVGKSGEQIVVKEEGKKVAEFRLNDIHHVALMGPIQISTALVHTLCECDIPLSWFSMGGWFYGITRGHSLKNVFTRIEQFRHAGDLDSALFLARLFVYGKIRNQRTLLMRNHLSPDRIVLKQMKTLAHASLSISSLESLLGIEGSAAMLYFSQFSGMLKTEEHRRNLEENTPDEFEFAEDTTDNELLTFDFQNRNRRPPKDPVNALLSLMYSLLAKDCTLIAYSIGLDPYVGFLHQPRFGRPALALDLMEEFRPLIAESVVLSLINTRIITLKDFIRAGQGVNLTPAGRKRAFLAYERRMNDAVTHPVFQYRVGYRRAIELQGRLLAKYLTGEIEFYHPFITR